MRARAKRRSPAWVWLTLGDLRAAYRWPWDQTHGGKYGAANDNAWVLWNGTWTHESDLASTRAYWRKHGWAK